LGEYDLVVSTKPWHPAGWNRLFGYENPCHFVPHGYDPNLHYRPVEDDDRPLDVVMVSTYREEYGRLILDLASLRTMNKVKMGLFGNGWHVLRDELPASWHIEGEVQGYGYRRALTLGEVYIAPVTREVTVGGVKYPGDEESTRTYELPAMGTCFVHRRTEYASSLFEENEVGFFDTADELAYQIERLLRDRKTRHAMRHAAQVRAVPRDSLDNRARVFLKLLREQGLLEE
jgi:glycosyltransferase involved in cell wall biosynthesis